MTTKGLLYLNLDGKKPTGFSTLELEVLQLLLFVLVGILNIVCLGWKFLCDHVVILALGHFKIVELFLNLWICASGRC